MSRCRSSCPNSVDGKCNIGLLEDEEAVAAGCSLGEVYGSVGEISALRMHILTLDPDVASDYELDFFEALLCSIIGYKEEMGTLPLAEQPC